MIVPSNCLVGTGRFMAAEAIERWTRTRLSTAVSPAIVSSSGVAVPDRAVASQLEFCLSFRNRSGLSQNRRFGCLSLMCLMEGSKRLAP